MRIFLCTILLLSMFLASCSDNTIVGGESDTDVELTVARQTLVAKYAGTRFVSVENLETGQSADGNDVLGKWQVSFTADVVSWDHDDVVEIGTYDINDEGVAVANFSGREIVFSSDEGNLEWDFQNYLELSSSAFESQETLVDYLSGSTYISVEEQDVGENASGDVAMGNGSIEFDDNQYTWNVQDTVLTGTYTYVGESTLALQNAGQDVNVYILKGDRLLISDEEYYRDTSEQINSQSSLVAYLDGSSYQSEQLQEVGETGDGSAAIGYWYINFTSDTFDWSYQDVQESGTYIYVDNSSFTAILPDRQYTIQIEEGAIIWDSLRYIRQ